MSLSLMLEKRERKMEESSHKAHLSCLPVTAIVIIIILLALFILYWLGEHGSREQRRLAKCFSNLKQIRLALNQYALDNNEIFPWGNDVEPCQALGKLHPSYASALEVFRCPSSSDVRWDIENAHLLNNKDNAPFTEKACKNSLSYAYSFNKDGNGKGIRGPWTQKAPSSIRIAADKYVTHDYSTDPNSKTQPSNHPIKRRWFRYKGFQQFINLDGSTKYEYEKSIIPLEADPLTEYENSGHPESDQTGADWWSDPPEK